jgi:hypothetical protein
MVWKDAQSDIGHSRMTMVVVEVLLVLGDRPRMYV